MKVGSARSVIAALALLLACSAVAPRASAAAPEADEYALKAAIYINLLRLVDWPAQPATDPSLPLTIGVVASDEMARALEAALHSRTAPARRIILRRISGTAGLAGLADCRSVFIGGDDVKPTRALIDALARTPVLTVGESDRFLATGGMIALVLKDDRIQIKVNLDIARGAGLDISSELLKVAQVRKGDAR